MNRRQILQYTAWITGSAVSTSLAGAVLSGCSEAPSGTGDSQASAPADNAELPILHYFTPAQFRQLSRLVDVLLPRTDSPSATDVKVHTTMDSMMGLIMDDTYKTQFKELWLGLLAYLDQHGFAGLDEPAQVALLSELELSQAAATAVPRQALLEVKQQAIAYYLTTEEVAKNHLNYVPVPGKYEPCIPVESVNNKAWAI